ncbi:integrase core domain protein [Candidatus Methanoplasma termitum]|uniref:Integrase core domain protein n=1 Tax=Candidatus Methanoplasma termitum TaxID=1577791 RepID=A0A0A7LAB9_9ARCH|nr:IS630 family transposase [Candidatus Methanoplasma termitum]AIZ56019.1 integrase core domain protein [Candidatus Methanoplasma termitum]AIZ56336.1 integrase core domain protein [Candidatus Methanoplasma termitum]AIZ56651.1 integrase core domain protein [Candidatus Methanoplasma termitum]
MSLNDIAWGFADESAQRISVNTARVWSLGRPVRKMNSDRVNANTFGFYAINGNSSVLFPESSKGADMCAFLDAIRAANGNTKVLMILDNGRIHHTKAVRSHAAELNIEFLFLPPYSPQFNPIEFIWKTVKARVSGMFLLCKDHLVEFVKETFMKESLKMSYAEGWKRTFLIDHESK